MKKRVLVLGARGFIGRHAVAALLDAGAAPIPAGRFPDKPVFSHPATNTPTESLLTRRITIDQRLDADAWVDDLSDIDVVLNCVGILRPTKHSSYKSVHTEAPIALAKACRKHSIRFIHLSALGLNSRVRSEFLTSKLAGENGIKQAGGDWWIVRPSLLDGDGGFGAAWLRGLARAPLFINPADATGSIAALSVTDLAEALARLCISSTSDGPSNEVHSTTTKELPHGSLQQQTDQLHREVELGGPHRYTFSEYVLSLRRNYTNRRALCCTVPGFLARIAAHICDLFSVTPFSYGHYELLKQDNVPNVNRLPELLGRPPTQVAPPA